MFCEEMGKVWNIWFLIACWFVLIAWLLSQWQKYPVFDKLLSYDYVFVF